MHSRINSVLLYASSWKNDFGEVSTDGYSFNSGDNKFQPKLYTYEYFYLHKSSL